VFHIDRTLNGTPKTEVLNNLIIKIKEKADGVRGIS